MWPESPIENVMYPKMFNRKMMIGLPLLLAMAFFFWWIGKNPVKELTESLPGSDNRVRTGDSIVEVINIGAQFEQYASSLPGLEESWSRFRGSDFDNVSKSQVKLIGSFGGSVPDTLWSLDLGEGHAGPAIYKGAVYILDYDEKKRADMLRCFSLTTGEEQWRRGYHVNVKRNHGMSRTVPAVTEDYILTIGPRSHVMCLDRKSGDFKWGLDMQKEYGTEIPFWYTGQCPLTYDGKAILATGGKAMLIAVDCETGELLWETPNEKGWKMSHSSIMPFTFGGHKMYVYSAIGGVMGVAADGPDEGKVLWSNSDWNHSVVAPSPVCRPDGKIFLTAGYGAGSMMIRLSYENGIYNTEVLQEFTPKEGLASEQQTPLLFEGHLLGILPKDAATLRNQLVCVDPDDCTNIIWSSGSTHRFGLGPY
ncbi:MAG: PQQ-binding-like beta-propeller repeat protein, partial [Bacteroidales bacterium]|nr:PQQ-binding-like beta-propeller repeat protein [Bacteroidales bacterium]